MLSIRNVASVLAFGAFALSTTACGTHAIVAPVRVQSAAIETQSVPPQSQFVVVSGKVASIMPDDTTGLPHQNFVITLDSGKAMTVNNDTKFGSKVTSLKVGSALSIRGVVYHNGNRDGIHWTHHANKANDAGYIKTADGTVFQ
ncbi:MAG: hypothetical protein JWM80_3333 [Cyanobacteria bacterium RYN_339]|nr:hypothetical protein [Cyanobacteria bacterium RYN_339]